METLVHIYIWTMTIWTWIPPVVSFLVTSQDGNPHQGAGSGPPQEILPSQIFPNFSNLILSCLLLSVGTLSSSSLAHLKVKNSFQVGPCENHIVFFPTTQQGAHVGYGPQHQQPGRSGPKDILCPKSWDGGKVTFSEEPFMPSLCWKSALAHS